MGLPRHLLCALVVTGGVFVACGFSGEGTIDPSAAAGGDGGGDGSGGDGPAPGTDAASDSNVQAVLPVFVPSHAPPGVDFDDAAADLTGGGVIDTSGTPSFTPALPKGARLAKSGDDYVLLFVHSWAVTSPVTITGDKPLIILASGSVTITSTIDAGASGVNRGPGGDKPGSGDGQGHNGGNAGGTTDTGGGGASFGGLGAQGGADPLGNRGDPGITYGSTFAEFFGGSGGGEGSPDNCDPVYGKGGAGGGAIQISARNAITVATGAWINAGGGGGQGGCSSLGGSGGGGGSGGTIVLEAPHITMSGTLAANGGGGGGGGSGAGYNGLPGTSAGKGLPAIVVAAGATSPPPGQLNAEGFGGNGAIEGTPATSPPLAANNQGGGGGGMGRIWLRGVGTPPAVTGKTSPKWVPAP